MWEMTGVTKHQSVSKQGVRGTGGEWLKKRSLCVCVWHEYYLWGELKWAEQNLIIRNNSLLYFLRKVFTFPFWQFTTTVIGKDFITKTSLSSWFSFSSPFFLHSLLGTVSKISGVEQKYWTNASLCELFPRWNATTRVMSMFISWLAIALGRKVLWVCSQYAHSLLLFSRSHVQLFATPWTAARQTPLSSSLSQFARIRVHWIGDAH